MSAEDASSSGVLGAGWRRDAVDATTADCRVQFAACKQACSHRGRAAVTLLWRRYCVCVVSSAPGCSAHAWRRCGEGADGACWCFDG
mmetsp:Transcript_11083/g.27662  ORF Transcript_11083/g.27662 Transcript_11083/m.27662 type:complete len:87 (-) Transcript_11083:260-520(-)|eukprot:4174956-Prymnesium_polylepis.1